MDADKITIKDAAVAVVPSKGDDGPGTWTAILSAQTKDRDGDTLTQDGWGPLPTKIPIDIDHGMTVSTTIGSAVPSFDADGNLVVNGTFSSIPRAQEVRTLMAEGHIDRMSVAFMTDTVTKDGKTVSRRELLNGAVVCIPSNREAAVLEVRSAISAKVGARNSANDLGTIQAIHDATCALGAKCVDEADPNGSDGDEKSFNTSDVATSGNDTATAGGEADDTGTEDVTPQGVTSGDSVPVSDVELQARALRLRATAMAAAAYMGEDN